MITVNGDKVNHIEGTTVASLLERLDFIFPLLIVRINGTLIDRPEYGRTQVSDGDNVEVIHLMSGG